MRRRTVIGISLAMILGSCSSGQLTLAEYAATVEALVANMESEFATIDGDWLAAEPSVDGAAEYWQERLAIRERFLDGVRSIEPPDGITETHAAALDVFGRITAADEALAASVAEYEAIDDHWQWVDTPEGRAADAILEEVFAFCRHSQAEFDATEQGEAFEDSPWLPSEMQQVVKVAFGCPPQEG